MSQSRSTHIPHYKTLDIIRFYNRVYDFAKRYLIFVFALCISGLIVIILWFNEPINSTIVYEINNTNSQGFIQSTGLLYPVNYFAQRSLIFDGNNKIYGLGGPIRRHEGMRNSLNNIVQYNGVILPRQISRSAWVPQLNQEYYSDSMIKTFLEGMAKSQVDIGPIESSIKPIAKKTIDGDLIDYFTIGCTTRSLVTKLFCDTKLIQVMEQWRQYDLNDSVNELDRIYPYITNSSNLALTETWCNALIKQYRYSANPRMQPYVSQCSEDIQSEVRSIADMIVVSNEVNSNNYTNTIYQNPVMNRYKLMSLYQYLMTKITTNTFSSNTDSAILNTYNSYIIKLADSNTIVQPYGDIIATFHTLYLIPWLQGRDSFASSEEKKITQELEKTTTIIINGDRTQNIAPITSGSKIRSVDFLVSQGLYYGSGSATTGEQTPVATPPVVTIPTESSPEPITSGQQSTGTDTPITTPTSSSIEDLIMRVIGVRPISINQRDQMAIINYSYEGYNWFATIGLTDGGKTQLYFESEVFGAQKITHDQVTFNAANREKILDIMNTHLSSITNNN